jgi:hypothetical protein
MTYDGLTARFGFRCPSRGEARVRLSSFRTVEQLPGATHPAVFGVTFACPCGAPHESLVAHDDLDWAPLAAPEEQFYNVMTGRFESAASELAEQAAAHIKRGRWPWCLFCYAEETPRPIFPSALRLVTPTEEGMVLAARCPSCSRTSVNLVSEEHLDVPFHNDREIGVVETVFADDVELGLPALSEQLASRAYEARPRRLEI